jgi:hypothetical protein
MPTALEIAQGRQTRLSAGLLMSVLTHTPLFSAFDVRTTGDTEFLTLSLDSLPSSQFVNLGEGLKAGTARMSIRRSSCSLIGGLVMAEVASAALWDRAHAQVGMNYFGIQADARIKADMLNVERQMIDGTNNDAKGFPGAKQITPFSGGVFNMTETAQKYNYARAVLDAGYGISKTANTASSVYSFVFGNLDSQLVWGNDAGAGEMFRFTDIRRQFIAPDSSKPTELLEHDIAQALGHIGLAVGGFSPDQIGQTVPTQYSLRRIANLTADVGAKLTDGHVDKLVRSHGPGRRPNLLAMSVRSGEQLAASRQPTAVNVNMGAGNADAQSFVTYPPPPENWRGIPIVYPLCIGEADAVES